MGAEKDPGDQVGEGPTHTFMEMLASSSSWLFVLAVLVLGQAVTWRSDASTSILDFGLAVGASILAISVYMWVKR